jgi:hypothetical protein
MLPYHKNVHVRAEWRYSESTQTLREGRGYNFPRTVLYKLKIIIS